MNQTYEIRVRSAKPHEFSGIGRLLADVYSRLDGFPSETEQPEYYKMLYNVGEFTKNPGTELLVGVDENDKILGAVVYFSDMRYYGSGGIATKEKNAAGFRLLAVSKEARGRGIGKLLTKECIELTKRKNIPQLIIHTTAAMKTAWAMYEKMGFIRSEDLDFLQADLRVFGFRLRIDK